MLRVLRADRLRELGFAHGFSTRDGGVSAPPYASLNLGAAVGDDPLHVAENQRRFAAAVGYRPERLFELSQVHGSAVRVLGASDQPASVRLEQGDGLVASDAAAIGIRTADCVPVLLADPHTRRVAALHAGWRGIAAGIVGRTVETLASASARGQLVAAVFPHIGVCCFDVGEDVAQTLASLAPAENIVRRDATRPHVDLNALVRLQLMAAGLDAGKIERVAGCTRCDARRFFSFRRDGQASGRHLTCIVAGPAESARAVFQGD
jgi:polyphenol oxidase